MMDSARPKLKILAIHGYRQSASTFRSKLGAIRKGFKNSVEFVFVDAPHEVPPSKGDSEIGYGWWFNTENREFKATVPSDRSVGFETSVALIERTFEASGPFHGILGFSQGAAFAAILCAMKQKKMTSIDFGFAILVSGFKSRCAPHSEFYSEELGIPSLHVRGTADRIIPPECARELGEVFAARETKVHGGGHYVGSKELYAAFLSQMALPSHASPAHLS